MWLLVGHNTNTSNNTFKERGRFKLYVCESNCGDYSDIRKLLPFRNLAERRSYIDTWINNIFSIMLFWELLYSLYKRNSIRF